MKAFLNLCCAVSFMGVISIAAGKFDLALSLPATNSSREVNRFMPSGATVFNPHARTKIVQYFDTYRNEPLGLPPGYETVSHIGLLPASWNVQGLALGGVVHQKERDALVETPADILRILPAGQPEVRYYLAGRHLVAVDSDYKIVDFIRIPTVRLSDREF